MTHPAVARIAKAILAQRSPSNKLLNTLFDVQRDFILDPAEFAVACCSRQAGKTRSTATAMLMKAMDGRERNIAYVALTRKSAKLICWRTLKSLNNQFKLGANFNESELLITFPNESVIQLTGANDQSVGETLRGLPWDLCVVDEAASFRGHIQNVIEECVAPAFITRNGKLKLIGTPSQDFKSYFYQAFHSLPEYSRHRWTVLDNPYIPNAAEYLKRLLERKGWTEDNPTYLREYCGQWVRSSEHLVYSAYNPLRNQCTLEAVPKGLHTVIGVDLGWNDANAIVVLGYNPQITRNVYVLHQRKRTKELISDLGASLRQLVDFYSPVAQVCDEGGLGRSIAEELNHRFNLGLKPAQKQGKIGYIELVNAALGAGELLIVDEERGLAEEWLDLPWKDESHTMEHPKYANHASDAATYAWRECTSYLHDRQEPDDVRVAHTSTKYDDMGDNDFESKTEWGGW